MRNAYKCPNCGYKNYSTVEDIDKRKVELSKISWPIIKPATVVLPPIPYIDEGEEYIRKP